MTTNKAVEAKAKELCNTVDITYELDVKIVKSYIDYAYWSGRVDENNSQRTSKKCSHKNAIFGNPITGEYGFCPTCRKEVLPSEIKQ